MKKLFVMMGDTLHREIVKNMIKRHNKLLCSTDVSTPFGVFRLAKVNGDNILSFIPHKTFSVREFLYKDISMCMNVLLEMEMSLPYPYYSRFGEFNILGYASSDTLYGVMLTFCASILRKVIGIIHEMDVMNNKIQGEFQIDTDLSPEMGKYTVVIDTKNTDSGSWYIKFEFGKELKQMVKEIE